MCVWLRPQCIAAQGAMRQVGILTHKREGMQAFSCASGAGCALTRDHESRRGRESPRGDWRGVPFRPWEQARGRKGNSRQPFGFPGPPDTKPRLRRDTKTTASRSARKGWFRTISSQRVRRGRYRAARSFGSIPPTSVSCRPKAVSCPREAGLSCPASDGTRRVAEGRGGGGRRSLTAAAPPDANRRSRSIA